ncbi:MAG: hypothetical protein AAF846_27015 [Chloroflexota bacterium]
MRKIIVYVFFDLLFFVLATVCLGSGINTIRAKGRMNRSFNPFKPDYVGQDTSKYDLGQVIFGILGIAVAIFFYSIVLVWVIDQIGELIAWIN